YQNLLNDLAGLDAVQDWIFQQPDATIDTPAAVEAAEIFQGWITSGYYPEGVNGIDYTTALGRFAAGEGVFYLSGNWDVASLEEQMGDNVGFFAAPPVSADGTVTAMTSPTTPFGIPANAEHKDAAAAFLNWLTSDAARQIQADQGYPPVGSADAAAPTVDAGTVNAEVQEAFAQLSEADALVDFVNNATAGIQASGWVPNLQLLVSGDLTPEAFVEAMQSTYEDELGR
ncbi:MAG TPA: extracellular solute-binding protein, partial [Cellulomonas sp.]